MVEQKSERLSAWQRVQQNSSYWPDALSQEEGAAIRWHSPDDPRSSQVFCISAFGGVRSLPDKDRILDRLFSELLPPNVASERWELHFEYASRELLGEIGLGTPTNVDVFCTTARAVICVESKFLFDALEGFGGCGQLKDRQCGGFYGTGSDRKTKSDANCRLEIADGRRTARSYWQLGRKFFRQSVFQTQSSGDICPFSGSNFQLMRNFLFANAAASDGRKPGILAIVPDRASTQVRKQIGKFKQDILRDEFQPQVSVATYDQLISFLSSSDHDESSRLGGFLADRMDNIFSRSEFS